MQYMGGKVRLAQEIISAMNINGRPFVDIFCGGGAIVERVVSQQRFANDSNRYMVALLEALSRGWIPPEVTEDDHRRAMADESFFPPELTGFILGPRSFRGAWRSGFAKSDKRHNYHPEAVRACVRSGPRLAGVVFTSLDYREVVIPEGAVVYCDPPYRGTRKYKGQRFDSDEFWAWASVVAQKNEVFVSEFSAPEGWVSVWSKVRRQRMRIGTAQNRVEHLFTIP